MRRLFLVCLLLLLTLGGRPAFASLDIHDVKAAYGPLGPERQSPEVAPGDEITFRFTVVGWRTDEAGRASGEMRMRLTDAKGAVLLDDKEPIGGVLALGGQTLPGTAQLAFAPDTPAGDYTLTVTVSDKLGTDSASFEQKVTCTKPKFALVQMGFFHDAAGTLAAPVGGTLGQTLYLRCKAVGYERAKANPRVVFTLQVMDSDGKPLMPRPVRASFAPTDKKQIATFGPVDFKGLLALNRVGEFRLRLTATDEVSHQTAAFEAPLRVTAP
jgi:hypothetical protein